MEYRRLGSAGLKLSALSYGSWVTFSYQLDVAAATYARQQIRVNAVAPGLMRTPATESLFTAPQLARQLGAQYPLGRYGQAGEVARAICWLLSDTASWITGQTLPVDGGFTAVRPLQRVS